MYRTETISGSCSHFNFQPSVYFCLLEYTQISALAGMMVWTYVRKVLVSKFGVCVTLNQTCFGWGEVEIGGRCGGLLGWILHFSSCTLYAITRARPRWRDYTEPRKTSQCISVMCVICVHVLGISIITYSHTRVACFHATCVCACVLCLTNRTIYAPHLVRNEHSARQRRKRVL